eukprot:09787.XXX_624053_624169_1 [CDS] Oithona nana genome sequencing.
MYTMKVVTRNPPTSSASDVSLVRPPTESKWVEIRPPIP